MIALKTAGRGTRRRKSGLSSFFRDVRVSAAFLLALALLLIVLSAPRVIAEAMLLPVATSLADLHRGDMLDAPTAARVAQALQSAQRFQPHDSRLAVDRGLLALSAIRRDGVSSEEAKPTLLSAIGDLETGLKQSPANAFAWALLAQARSVRDATLSDSAKAALRNSYYVGPFDHGAMLVRSEIVLPNWRLLDGDLEPFARREILNLWQRSWDDQKAIIKVVCATNAISALSDALRGNAAARKEFDQFYEPYLSPEGCKKAP